MVQRKTFFDKVVQKVRRDAGAAWTGANLDDMRSISSLVEGRLGSAGERLAEAGFMPALQQEALIRALDERRRAELGCKADDPPVFPGLMAAWDSRPATLSFDGALLDRARKSGIETLTAKLDSVRELLPLCLLADIRPWGADLYGNPVDALFMYPSHDLDRGYDVFLLVAVGLKTGLRMPAESRLVLSGDTLADAVDLSVAERELLRGRCLAGIDNGLHDEIFSPFEDEEAVMLLAADALGLLFHGISEMDAAEGPRGLRITARLAEEPASSAAVDAEGAAPPEEPDVESRDDVGTEQVAHIVAGDDGDASEASAGSGEGAGESQGGDSGPSTAPGASVSCIGESHDAAELTAQIESLRSQLEAAESKASTLEYHLRQANSMAAEAQREAQGALARASVLETLDLPATAAEALALAERAFPDRLAVMPDARKSA
ncbi:MAG: hypothetical protein IJ087_09515, partial [Eggerthellaceae bacterium]|nr:hypothetical protein [Eggerthellaceae bacterium]